MYKHILVPLDGSKLAEQAIPHASEIARLMGAKMTLMSCVEPYMVALPAPIPFQTYPPETDLQCLISERSDYLEGLKKELSDNGVEADTATYSGPPASEILEAAKEKNVDLIVMTTHGRTGIRKLIYGSVAEEVMQNCHIPVLMVRPNES